MTQGDIVAACLIRWDRNTKAGRAWKAAHEKEEAISRIQADVKTNAARRCWCEKRGLWFIVWFRGWVRVLRGSKHTRC